MPRTRSTRPTPRRSTTPPRIVARSRRRRPNLVFLRDKALLFDDERDGFVMYGVQGRTWVAMGDPVGPPSCMRTLIRLFLERCDDFGGVPVFYEIGHEHLHRYADFGLTFVKLGEEARVDLRRSRSRAAHGAKYRQAMRRLESDGGTFRVIAPADVPAHLPSSCAASRTTGSPQKAGAEKGFSLGFFDEDYLAPLPGRRRSSATARSRRSPTCGRARRRSSCRST